MMSLELYRRGVDSYLKGNNKLLQKIIASPQLSLDGKRLLKARHYMRLQDFVTALDLLNRAPCKTAVDLEGDRLFLLGSCHAFRGRWQAALEFNLLALQKYDQSGFRRGQFLSHYNLSVDCQHLGDVAAELRHLQKANALVATADEKALVARAEAFLLAREERFDSALALLESALKTPELNTIDHVQILILRVEILTMAGNLSSALKFSSELLNRKSTFERARIVFENHALRFLSNDRLAFSSERPAVLEASIEYQLKWDLIRALQFGEQDRAADLWNDLAREIPGHLQLDFLKTTEYERRSIFGRCLEKLRGPQVHAKFLSTALLEQQLVDILSTAKVPLRKEILIEFLWSVKYCSSFDNRFYQLIRRLRKKGVNIQNIRFAYRL